LGECINFDFPQGEGSLSPYIQPWPMFTKNKKGKNSTKAVPKRGESIPCQTTILEIECLIHRVNYKKLLVQVAAMSLKLFFN
jgi:hypothetical protein